MLELLVGDDGGARGAGEEGGASGGLFRLDREGYGNGN